MRLTKCFLPAVVVALVLSWSVQAASLRDVYEQAVEYDAKFKLAHSEYKAKVETEKQARSRLLPQVNVDRSFGSTHSAKDAPEVTSGIQGLTTVQQHTDQQVHDRRWELSVTQPIVDVSAIYGYKSGKATTEQAGAELSYASQELIIRVAKAYLGALQQTEAAATSRIEVAANEKQWTQAQAKKSAGFAATADVEQARTEYELSVAKLAADEGNQRAAFEALTTITGRTYERLSVLAKDFPIQNPEPFDAKYWVDNAQVHNNTLSASRFAVRAAKSHAMSAKMAHLPTVGIQLGYSDYDVHGNLASDPYSPYTLPPQSEGWSKSGSISVRMPLYSGGYTSSRSRETYAQYYGELDRKNDLERSIIENTRTLFIAVQTDVIRIRAQRQAITSAEAALTATRAGYTRGGIKSIVDVLQSQRIYFEAVRDYTNARLDYVMNWLQLREMAGLLSPQDIDEIDRWLVPADLALGAET